MKLACVAAGSLAFALGLVESLSAASITLTAVKDNTLFESPTGALSSGQGAGLFVGKTNTNAIRRALLQFDIAGNLPPAATIQSVSLRLNMEMTISGGQTTTLHRSTADWGEGPSASGSRGGGGGSQAAPGDATWLHRSFPGTLWSTPGGDFAATASASSVVAASGQYMWNSTPQLVADVQSWLTTPASNFGWLIQGNENQPTTAKRFSSRESATASIRPSLTIEYTVPLSAWHNSARPLDIDNDGNLFPIDALLIINRYIREGGAHTLPLPATPPPYYDTDGNGELEAVDALLVLNELIRNAGVGASPVPEPASWGLLAAGGCLLALRRGAGISRLIRRA